MYYGLSLLAFTQSVAKENSFQDVVFYFDATDDTPAQKASSPVASTSASASSIRADNSSRPLLAHGNVLSYYSPVFAKMLRENEDERDDKHRIKVRITNAAKSDYEAFIRGIYWRFTDKESRTNASKEIFRLVRDFQLPADLVENLFSARNVWRCLEFAVDDPAGSESFLLQKCEKMLRQNRCCFTDSAAGGGVEGIKATTIAFVLHLPALPLKTAKELKDFIRLWKRGRIQEKEDELAEEIVMGAVMDMVMKDEAWHVSVLHVQSIEVPCFTVEYIAKASLQTTLGDMQFVSQVPKELICLTNTSTGDEIDVKSDKRLNDLGILEDCVLFLRIRKVIRLLFSGSEHHIDIKDIQTVEELRRLAEDVLIARAKNVDNYSVNLLKDGVALQDGSLLDECGIRANSKISLALEYNAAAAAQRRSSVGVASASRSSIAAAAVRARQRRLRYGANTAARGSIDEDDDDVFLNVAANLAADPAARLTASSSYEEGRSPRHALPHSDDEREDAEDATCWCANSDAPAWWRVEFPAPPKILRRVGWRAHPAKACDGDNPASFRIEGGNRKTVEDRLANEAYFLGYDDEDDAEVRWTPLLRRDQDRTPFGTDCVYDVNKEGDSFQFCRIFIESTRYPGNFPVLHRVVIEGDDAEAPKK